MNILIVEDDQGIAFLLGEALESLADSISLVYTGGEALNFIRNNKTDLIVLDYSLPDMNASEIISKLREENISIPPFIISTGQGDEIIAVEMMKMGAHDYLVKDASLIKRIPGVVQRAIDDIRREKALADALKARQISDEKLLEEQKRLENIINAARVGTWEWKVQSDEVVFNQLWAQMIGYTLDELHPANQHTIINLTHPDDLETATLNLRAHLNGDSNYYEAEVRLRHKSNKYIWVLTRGCIMEYSAEGTPVLMAGTTQDITDKIDREKLQKEVEVAHQTLEFKQNFLASMSHEMRTPLTGILGIAELLEKTPLNPQQTDLLSTLRNASVNLRDIIDQVLDYSKIESGRMKVAYTPFPVQAIIDKAKEMFQSICRKPIEFVSFIESNLPGVIKADEKRLTQVINNLMVNAVKFSDRGEITVSVFLDEIISENQFRVRVEVKDTGIGIQKEKHELIFSPFSQVHQIDTSYYEGTGLGLAIYKEIVHMHGGDIGIESAPGEGTTVWFTFLARYHKADPVETGIRKVMHPDFRLNILLVEDKTITQKVVMLQLKDMGHEVVIAANGREAIDKFFPGKFDLILMDIQMPVMDGITATRELRKLHKKLPPVVGLSANAFEGDREKYMGMGFDEYLTKPMQRDQFIDVVSRIFLS